MATVDICVLDNTKYDPVSLIDRISMMMPDHAGVKDTKDIVQRVCLRCANGDRIGELRIIGHGNDTGQYFGADWVSLDTLPKYRDDLGRLRGLFSSEGMVTLGGCLVGRDGGLLVELSNLLNVPVRGFTASQRPLVPGDQGSETRCYITCTRGSKDNFWDWVDK